MISELAPLSARIGKVVDELSKTNHLRHLETILKAVYQENASSINHLPVPVQLKERVNPLLALSVHPSLRTDSKQCIKTLLRLQDGQSVESVWMKFRDNNHSSLCISSQVGCALRCSFCATGRVGFKRQLTVDEITDQVLDAFRSGNPVKTVAVMGMGESLLNPNLYRALTLFTHTKVFAWSPRRFSVSTIGVIPGIQKMTEMFPQVNIAFSLHSPFEDQRCELIPAGKTYPLDEALKALHNHADKTRRKIILAYLVLPGYNDSKEHALAIGSLFKKIPSNIRRLFHMNLLRYNPAFGVDDDYSRTSPADMLRFSKMLKEQNIPLTIRQSFGVDIDAACGQLYRVAQSKKHTVAAAAK